VDNRPWAAAAQPRLSVLRGDTINEWENVDSLTVRPEKFLDDRFLKSPLADALSGKIQKVVTLPDTYLSFSNFLKGRYTTRSLRGITLGLRLGYNTLHLPDMSG
jgi:hypothetical protein